MFENFKIQKFLDKKPPSNNSFTTMQEIKELNKIPINVILAKKNVVGIDTKEDYIELKKNFKY